MDSKQNKRITYQSIRLLSGGVFAGLTVLQPPRLNISRSIKERMKGNVTLPGVVGSGCFRDLPRFGLVFIIRAVSPAALNGSSSTTGGLKGSVSPVPAWCCTGRKSASAAAAASSSPIPLPHLGNGFAIVPSGRVYVLGSSETRLRSFRGLREVLVAPCEASSGLLVPPLAVCNVAYDTLLKCCLTHILAPYALRTAKVIRERAPPRWTLL